MKERIEKIKAHLYRHRVAYSCTATGIAVAGFTYFIMRSKSSQRIGRGIPVTASRGIPVTGESVVIDNASKFLIGSNRILNTVSYISAERSGPPSWVIRCIETGVIFTSQNIAASEMDLPASEISRQLNGVIDHVRGYTFERICMAA